MSMTPYIYPTYIYTISAKFQLYIEGYLQAMLDVMYKQEYLRIRVIDDQVTPSNIFLFCYILRVLINSLHFCFWSNCNNEPFHSRLF